MVVQTANFRNLNYFALRNGRPLLIVLPGHLCPATDENLLQVNVKPHDLRRTFGKLAHKGGARIEQIQRSCGHASIQTTERYLGVEQDLADAPCDHLKVKP
jgi:integrase